MERRGKKEKRQGRRLAKRYDAAQVLWPRLSPVREGSARVMGISGQPADTVDGIWNVREVDGIAIDFSSATACFTRVRERHTSPPRPLTQPCTRRLPYLHSNLLVLYPR